MNARSRKNLFLLTGCFYMTLYILCPPFSLLASEKTKTSDSWSYVVENGIEKSKRTYLLIHSLQGSQERRITVVSECQKPVNQEGVYGKCSHKIRVMPTGATFTAQTGEEVVIVQTDWDSPLILGTIDYGCCAGPIVTTFYREDGKRIGALKKPPETLQTLYGNTITRTWDLRNSTGRHEKKPFFVIQDDQKESVFFALTKDKNNDLLRIPVSYIYADEKKCEEWFLAEFIKYGDRDDITFVLEGFFCNNNLNKGNEGYEKLIFSCHEVKNGIDCKVRE